jgi:ComF family protein
MEGAIMNIWSILDQLFPTRCLFCDGEADSMPNLCHGCEQDLPWVRGRVCPSCALPVTGSTVCGRCLRSAPAFSRTVAALRYEGSAARLIQRFKFHADLVAGACLSGLMLRAVEQAERPDLLVPVPLALARARQRGFDQALELAKPLGRQLGIAVDYRAARRPVHREAQSTLRDRALRQRNVRDVFHVEPLRVEGQHVAVVDDVMTSGATAQSLAACMLHSGAARVDVWVASRAGLAD